MGLLDDAIREHLDLQRRRGADPSEVERAEREALGPVRRAQAPATQEIDEPLVASAGVAYDHEDEDDGWSFEEEGAAAPEPRYAEPEPEPGYAGPESEDDPFAEAGFEPAPAASPNPAEPDQRSRSSRITPHPAGGETVEYDVEHALGSADEPTEKEDMLEETPEFLQDTPDHDRLWFEQRPPKDFDFDG